MPIYVYRCPECGQILDRTCSIDLRDKAPECEYCECDMRRAMTSPEVRMKGGTRNHNRFPIVPIETRLKSQYGDNP